MRVDQKNEIIMLAGEGAYTLAVYNYFIQHNVAVSVLIIEQSESRKSFLRKRIKKLGVLHVFGQILNRLFVIEYLKFISRKRVNEISERASFNYQPAPNEKVINVPSVNSKACLDVLKQIGPKQVVVVNTRVISKNILRSINARFINIHAGITPMYRGWHGGYWALVNNDRENCGVTVHLVDEGIDTGKILYQDIIKVTKDDNYYTYPFLQLEKGLPLLLKAVTNNLHHDALTKKEHTQDTKGKLYSHPTIWAYIFNRVFKKIH